MYSDKTSATTESLIEQYRLKSLRKQIGATIPADDIKKVNRKKDGSLVRQYLQSIGTEHYGEPYLWRDLILSLYDLPVTAWLRAQQNKSDVPTLIAWSSPEALRLKDVLPLIGATAIREKNARAEKRAVQPLSIAQTMLLHYYQISPRPVSWFVHGLCVIDMLAWMYQDVIAMEAGLGRRLRDFEQNLPAYRDWLRRTPPRSGNTPLRHLRVHLAACLGVNTTTIERVINDQSDYTLPVLLQKLIEQQSDNYYSKGVLRHYKDMRDDFNTLSEYAIKCQHGVDSVQYRRISQIKCPSLYTADEFKHISLRVSHKQK